MAEVALAAGLMRRWVGGHARLDQLAHLARFAAVAAVAAPASGLLIAALSATASGRFDPALWMQVALRNALGLLIVAPTTMVVLHAWRGRRPPSRQLVEGAAILVAVVLVIGGLFAQATLRLGAFGSAMSIAAVAGIAILATSSGYGPIAHLVTAPRFLLLQLFLATNVAVGLPVAAILAGLDRARAELARERDVTASMVENMREVLFRADREGRWVFLSPAWEAVTGYPVDHSLGRRTTDLLHPDDLADAHAFYPRLVAGEITDAMLHQRFTAADDACRHIEVSVRALRTADGAFDGTIGNIRDVTDSRAASLALRDSELRFLTLSDSIPVGLFLTDADGETTFVNRAFQALSGLSAAQAMGDGWADAIHPADRPRDLGG